MTVETKKQLAERLRAEIAPYLQSNGFMAVGLNKKRLGDFPINYWRDRGACRDVIRFVWRNADRPGFVVEFAVLCSKKEKDEYLESKSHFFFGCRMYASTRRSVLGLSGDWFGLSFVESCLFSNQAIERTIKTTLARLEGLNKYLLMGAAANYLTFFENGSIQICPSKSPEEPTVFHAGRNG